MSANDFTAGITFNPDPGAMSTKAMMSQMDILAVHAQNIANYGIPGYQRKMPFVVALSDAAGRPTGQPGLQTEISTEIGRLRRSGNPLDVALNTEGYFQRQSEDGQIEFSRDGRFRLDQMGRLLSVDNKAILGTNGQPIQFPVLPTKPENQIKIDTAGNIILYDRRTGRTLTVARISVVQSNSSPVATVDMKQGYVEDSNVFLAQEFAALIPIRRGFEANKQMYKMQDSSLSRAIQQLTRTQ
jgi:flagellar basal-body rod protein FlgF